MNVSAKNNGTKQNNDNTHGMNKKTDWERMWVQRTQLTTAKSLSHFQANFFVSSNVDVGWCMCFPYENCIWFEPLLLLHAFISAVIVVWLLAGLTWRSAHIHTKNEEWTKRQNAKSLSVSVCLCVSVILNWLKLSMFFFIVFCFVDFFSPILVPINVTSQPADMYLYKFSLIIILNPFFSVVFTLFHFTVVARSDLF